MRVKPLIGFVLVFALLPACNLFTISQPMQTSLPTTQMELTFSGTSSDALPGYEQIEAHTLDGEVIYVDVTLLFKIDPSKMMEIQEQGGANYPIVLLKPLLQSVIQDVTAQYSARGLFGDKRTEWIEKLRGELKQKLLEKGFLYSDFVVRSLQFTKEFSAKIEQELIATMTLEAQIAITSTP